MTIFQTCFLSNIGQKNVFYDILEKKKTTFYTITTRSSKSRKLEIFPKGLTHGFGSKMAFFPNLGQKNVLYDILELKKRLSRLRKQRV